MKWLNKIVDEVLSHYPEGEIIVSSGVSPSGAYHLGTLREVLTAEIVAREIRRRGRECRHLHISDDLDVFRKLPAGLPESYSKYLGVPLCDIPAPDGSKQSYADYYVNDLPKIAKILNCDMEILRAHKKYRSGFFVPMIETTLKNIDHVKKILVEISGRDLDEQWSPVQVIEDGFLKNRKFLSINVDKHELNYEDNDKKIKTINYDKGNVKLNWRIDWPARWALLGVQVEPFGRDHATKGGSYDTGAVIAEKVFNTKAPYPIPYHFVNKSGETKKMSKSGGDTITAIQLISALPPEIVWYFMFKFAPEKQLFFDTGPTLIRLVDEFSELLAKRDKSSDELQLLDLCTNGIKNPTVSNIPFSHLVASYQASLRDIDNTLEVIKRTEYSKKVDEDFEIIKNELKFIDNWLNVYAPDDVKFELTKTVDSSKFTDIEKSFLRELAEKINHAPEGADGEWFHKEIYQFKEKLGITPKELFTTLYRAIIGKDSGPRAGWFLSILPRDWLVKRLNLEE